MNLIYSRRNCKYLEATVTCPPTTEWGNCISHWVSNCKTHSNDQMPKTQSPWKKRKATRLTGLDWRTSTHKINMVSEDILNTEIQRVTMGRGHCPWEASCPVRPADDVLCSVLRPSQDEKEAVHHPPLGRQRHPKPLFLVLSSPRDHLILLALGYVKNCGIVLSFSWQA